MKMKNNSQLRWHTVRDGIRQAELLPAYTVHRRPPINLNANDYALFNHELKRSWSPCIVVTLDKLHIVGNSWLQWRYARVVDNFRPSHSYSHLKLGRLRDLLQLRHAPLQVEEALWVHDDWSGNYFHWLTDVLPKLLAYRKSGETCREVLLPQQLLSRQYVSESLAHLGFCGIGFNSSHLKVRRLIVIGSTAPTGNFRSGLLKELANHLRSLDFKSTDRSLYISRADAVKRFLINESKLSHILKSHGIHSVQLEGCSLTDQIKMFSSCRLIVGLHGAGLTNMLWMEPGSHVIEIRRRGDHIGNCYFSMANSLSLSYSYILADDITESNNTHEAELVIDINSFEKLLAGYKSDIN